MSRLPIETQSDEMTPHDLERLMVKSFSKKVTEPELRRHLRAVIKECQRLQGALMLKQVLKQ